MCVEILVIHVLYIIRVFHTIVVGQFFYLLLRNINIEFTSQSKTIVNYKQTPANVAL